MNTMAAAAVVSYTHWGISEMAGHSGLLSEQLNSMLAISAWRAPEAAFQAIAKWSVPKNAPAPMNASDNLFRQRLMAEVAIVVNKKTAAMMLVSI
jgi:hypothetical protein